MSYLYERSAGHSEIKDAFIIRKCASTYKTNIINRLRPAFTFTHLGQILHIVSNGKLMIHELFVSSAKALTRKTGRTSRLTWVFNRRTYDLVGFF